LIGYMIGRMTARAGHAIMPLQESTA